MASPGSLPELLVSAPALQAVRRGHPWVWRDAISRHGDRPAHGALVRLVDEGRDAAALAVYSADGSIAARVWGLDRARPELGALASARIDAALARRERLIEPDTSAYRLVHGEGDGLGGVVVDRYGEVLVMEAEGGATAHVELLGDILWARREALKTSTILFKNARATGPGKVGLLRGAAVSGPVVVTEHGVPFEADLLEGQKTGAFLDQRENRRLVRDLAHGRRVLNLFSYAGGFSVQAALGGASHVTSVDVASKAHASAARNVARAGLDLARFSFVTADCFTWLEQARARGARYDLIVCDPPAMARSEKAVPKATKAYRDLHAGCIELLADGGIFCAASCSSHMHLGRFLETLDARTLAGRSLAIVRIGGAPACHPLLPGFAEGAYLKFVVMT